MPKWQLAAIGISTLSRHCNWVDNGSTPLTSVGEDPDCAFGDPDGSLREQEVQEVRVRQPDRFVLAPGLVYRSAKCGDLLPMKSLISILAGILSAVLLFTLGRTSCLSRTISDDGQQPVARRLASIARQPPNGGRA